MVFRMHDWIRSVKYQAMTDVRSDRYHQWYNFDVKMTIKTLSCIRNIWWTEFKKFIQRSSDVLILLIIPVTGRVPPVQSDIKGFSAIQGILQSRGKIIMDLHH